MPDQHASGVTTPRPIRICRSLQVEGHGGAGLALTAANQRGLVHRSQLTALGLRRGAVAHRVSTAALHRVFPSVFAVGHRALAPWTLETAALLHCGDDCLISHATAAALWGLVPLPPPDVSVTAIGRHPRCQPHLCVHRVVELDPRDIRIRHGLPVTAPARTVVDFAGEASASAAAAALNEARVLGLVSDKELMQTMDRAPLRGGVGRLRAILAAERGPAVTRSEAERRLRKIVEEGELPWPQFNVWLFGHLVDALWSEARLVVEVDGYIVHGHRRAFESDRRRDQRLAAQGFTVVRITARQLREEPMAVLGRLAMALGRASQG